MDRVVVQQNQDFQIEETIPTQPQLFEPNSSMLPTDTVRTKSTFALS